MESGNTLIERAADIYRRISQAALRAGREPSDVELVAVTKQMDKEAVAEAFESGLRVFGESRVQEAGKKVKHIKELDPEGSVRWHMVGRLQSNKARAAVGMFDLIHSVDSPGLMRLIDRHAGAASKVQRCLIQVKLAGHDKGKTGVDEQTMKDMIEEAKGLKNISLEGLMCIPPYSNDQEDSRPYYKSLARLAEEAGLKGLSMGMSNDFEVGVQEGATMVRVGSAIFGPRQKEQTPA